MVNYTCPRCNFTTHIKTKYTTHLRRKFICENIISDDDLINEYIKYNINEKLKNVQNLSKPSEMNQNEPNEPDRAETSRILRVIVMSQVKMANTLNVNIVKRSLATHNL